VPLLGWFMASPGPCDVRGRAGDANEKTPTPAYGGPNDDFAQRIERALDVAT
jgi:hypothetical protein